ncbi:MAG: hypothetical protein R3B13_27155 [Polyangiaceae bacterium]
MTDRRSRLLLASAVVLLGVLRCGGEAREPGGSLGGAAGTGGGGGIFDAGGADADAGGSSGGGAAGMSADEKYAWVCQDGGTKPTGKLEFSCCGGHVCLGSCEQGQCHCGGISGGCELPSLCCVISGQHVCGGQGVCKPLG